jgi:hypothetical protein
MALALFWWLVWALFHGGANIEEIAWARFYSQGFLCAFTLTYAYYLTSVDIRP